MDRRQHPMEAPPRHLYRPEPCLYALAQTYRRNLWDDAEDYVEIWVEKDALAGVIVEETEPLDVPLMVAKGYTSKTYAYGAARRYRRRNGAPEAHLHLSPRRQRSER